MKDEVDARGEQIDVAAEGCAHAALDAIAIVGLAEDLACGETDAGGSIGNPAEIRAPAEQP